MCRKGKYDLLKGNINFKIVFFGSKLTFLAHFGNFTKNSADSNFAKKNIFFLNYFFIFLIYFRPFLSLCQTLFGQIFSFNVRILMSFLVIFLIFGLFQVFGLIFGGLDILGHVVAPTALICGFHIYMQ